MVTLLANELGHSQRGGLAEMSDEERADYLLKKLEEAGMLPPMFYGIGGMPINRWESENEN